MSSASLEFEVEVERLEVGGGSGIGPTKQGGPCHSYWAPLSPSCGARCCCSLLLTSPSHRFFPLRQAVHAQAPRLELFGSWKHDSAVATRGDDAAELRLYISHTSPLGLDS